jgi:hypothetical protein
MTTADYALIVSLASALTSVVALLWNVWQKYIFVKPALQVTFGVYRVMERASIEFATPSDHQLLTLTVTNMGPGPAVLQLCVAKRRSDIWRRGRVGMLNPIHGDATSRDPISQGPYSGGLPCKIEAGEVKSFYFPYNGECFLKDDIYRAGISDTYRRISWCRRRDAKKVMDWYRKDFMDQRAGDFEPSTAH